MTKAASQLLGNGLYRVWWKSGGSSLAAVGVQANGDRWLAPTNWIHPTEDQNVWRSIERMAPVRPRDLWREAKA